MGLTIAGEGEGNEVSVSHRDINEHPDQNHVEYHPLHQHPHEGHQEEVVQQDSHCLATGLGERETCDGNSMPRSVLQGEKRMR